jgi:hypothetical protein
MANIKFGDLNHLAEQRASDRALFVLCQLQDLLLCSRTLYAIATANLSTLTETYAAGHAIIFVSV